MDLTVVHVLHGLFQLRGRRRDLIRSVEIIEILRFADGDVEFPIRQPAVFQALFYHLNRFRITGNRLAPCMIDAVNVRSLFGLAQKLLVMTAFLKGAGDRLRGIILAHILHVIDGDAARCVKVETLPGNGFRLCGTAGLWYNDNSGHQRRSNYGSDSLHALPFSTGVLCLKF